MKRTLKTTAILLCISTTALVVAESAPKSLARGEAPLIFAQGVAGSNLRNSVTAQTDEIYLWVPALKFNGAQVDLATSGRFFLIWDSGPVAGPNGNDDNTNELRALHFEAATKSFLLSYDDSTTTGFEAPFNAIADSALLRMTPTSATNGFVDGWSFDLVYDEGVPGTTDVLTDGDIYGFAVAGDGTLYWGGGSVTIPNDQAGTTTKASNDLAHTTGGSTPVHIGASIFFFGNPIPPPGHVFPTFINGQWRGVDELTTGELLISVSDTFNQPNAGDTTSVVVLDRWDIGGLDPTGRMADVVYPGELFFQTIDTLNAEMLDFDVLDTASEINAMLELLGPTSEAGLALRAFADPPQVSIGDVALLTNVETNSLSASIRSLDPNSGAILGTFVHSDFNTNGALMPIEGFLAGPGRTVLVAQPDGGFSGPDGKIAQYDADGNPLGDFLGGTTVDNPVHNIRGLVRSPDGNYLITSDWTGDNIHRFNFFTGVAVGADPNDGMGVFVDGMLAPPNLDQPQAMEVLSNGDWIVADIGQGKLMRYNPQTGAVIGEFYTNPVAAAINDIDELPSGDVLVAEGGGGDRILRFSAGGALLSSFSFDEPQGVHELPNGDLLVTSGSTFGQGQGLFRVSATGTILEVLDNSRAYGPIELIRLEHSPTCDGDANGDGIVDLTDLAIVLAVFDTGNGVPGFMATADFNEDGVIDLTDLAILLANFDAPCP